MQYYVVVSFHVDGYVLNVAAKKVYFVDLGVLLAFKG